MAEWLAYRWIGFQSYEMRLPLTSKKSDDLRAGQNHTLYRNLVATTYNGYFDNISPSIYRLLICQ